MVEPGRPQMTIWRMRIACWTPKATKNILRICNTCCFSTATMVTRTRLSVTLHYVACLLTFCEQLPFSAGHICKHVYRVFISCVNYRIVSLSLLLPPGGRSGE
jgi:hypothetical protein